MHIVHVAAEFSPLAVAGGLGEAVAGLSYASAKWGHKVRVILPNYPSILKKYPSRFKEERYFPHKKEIWKATFKQVEIFLITPNAPNQLFGRENIYGYSDDLTRFACFCHSALELLAFLKEDIDILHLHDWHTALIPCLHRSLFQELKIKKTVLTIHNLSYQGIGIKHDLEQIGLYPKEPFHQAHLQSEDIYKPFDINLLKSGIEEADEIVTVSPTYAKEILEEPHSCGLYKTLHKNQTKLQGIINGIDTEVWNPENDPFIHSPFSPYQPIDEILYHKRRNREDLQKKYFEGKLSSPLVAFIGRLVPQKGLDLLESALFFCAKEKISFILLGSTNDPSTLESFQRLKTTFSSQKHLAIHLSYDEALAHKIYAGADLLLVPSQFEPCGLVQLTALRYGTLPIVHKTGGLADTVFDTGERKNGFLFTEYSKEALQHTLSQAINLIQKDPKAYQAILSHALKDDYSWGASCKKYLSVYNK